MIDGNAHLKVGDMLLLLMWSWLLEVELVKACVENFLSVPLLDDDVVADPDLD